MKNLPTEYLAAKPPIAERWANIGMVVQAKTITYPLEQTGHRDHVE
ncbi:hypothetical protein [Nitrosomonas sp. Is37]|nr:hypothetical protein [Nitrosomonas sp. Is37]MDV6344619.1 hypothetical protein [Nitrosomonas sp. Is37]